MMCQPLSDLLQICLAVAFFALVVVSLLMYLDGYWTSERVAMRRDAKWKRDNPFSALDRKHFGRGGYK